MAKYVAKPKIREFCMDLPEDGGCVIAAGMLDQALPKGRYKLTVEPLELEKPEAPTRVHAKVRPAFDGQTAYELPSSWNDGEDVTVILGRDELPEEVRDACNKGPWYIAPAVLPDFIRSRWPEAFK
jgi:hypothetical protein